MPVESLTQDEYGNIGYVDVPDAANNTDVVISLVATDSLNAFDPTIITGHLANSANTAHFGKVIGLTSASASIGFSVSVITEGVAQNAMWSWATGSIIFLNGTTLSQTPPSSGFLQQIGIAKASDTIYVDLSQPIQL